MISKIPFKILSIGGEGFHLMMKLKINGKLARVIIDTGASKTVFDSSRIKKYVNEKSFFHHDKLSSGLGTNTMTSQTVVLKKITIGELELKDYETVLLDLSHVNNSYQQVGLNEVEGVLGSDILLKYDAVIDYKKKVLLLKFSRSKK